MDRKEFLAQVGTGAAGLILFSCLGGCSKQSDGGQPPAGSPAPTPRPVDFMLDLTLSRNAALANNGGFVYANGVIVAKAVGGEYIAVSQACTHQGTAVEYQTSDRFYCPNHGSVFSKTGAVVVGPATAPLTRYNTALTGNQLRVFS